MSCVNTHRTITYGLKNVAGDMEAFLSGLMDKNDVPEDFMDDENYLFSGEGMFPSLSIVPTY